MEKKYIPDRESNLLKIEETWVPETKKKNIVLSWIPVKI